MSSPTAQPPGKAFASMTKLSVPIVSAPMAGVSGGDLAASVARAGGLGFIGAGMMSNAEQLQREYEKAVALNGDSNERIGIGLVGFTGSWLVDTAVSLEPSAMWISFGDYKEAAAKMKGAGIPLMIMVQSVEEAVQAAELGADAVVAQGSESGGHGCGPTSTLCFVPEVMDALQQAGKQQVPVLAAGGIADGRQVAAVLALGAAGAVLGTRFAVTQESMLSAEKKQRYLAAKAGDTRRTRLYDDLGPLDWPIGVDGRLIGNAFTSAHGDVAPAEEGQLRAAKQELETGQKESNLDVVPMWCGAGVGLIHSIESAEDVVSKMWAQAKHRFSDLSKQYL